jgi:hypothetical protein
MKMKLYTAAGLIVMAGLVSCGGNNDKEVVDKSIMPTGTDTTPVQTAAITPPAPNQIAVPAAIGPNVAPIIPGVAANSPVTVTQPQTVTMNPQNGTVVTAPQTITQTAAAQTATAPGMNPPHGQPGHRCDISVGAPLNSKPAPPPATVATTPAQPQVTMKEVPTTTKTAPGMNPPHGEPGHRCEIAVGAPLNSKPATVTPTAAPANIAPPALLTAPKADSGKN